MLYSMYTARFSRVAVFAGLLLTLLVAVKWVTVFTPFPGIMPDELTYMRASFFPEVEQRFYGNPLHSLLYSGAESCGVQWYQCVKGVNLVMELVFALGIAITLFLLTKNLEWSVLIGLVTLAGPFLMYSSYFMPESLQAALVSLSFATLLLAQGRGAVWSAIPGLFLGLSMLSKPHGVAIAALSLVAALLLFANRRFRQWPIVKSLAVFGFVAFISRTSLGFLLAGPQGLSPFASYFNFGSLTTLFSGQGEEVVPVVSGEAVDQMAASSAQSEALRIGPALLSVISNIAPALIVLCLVLGFVLFVLKANLRKFLANPYVLVSLLFFLAMVALTASFGALLELRGSENTAFRTMTRYWEYTIPFLIASTAVFASRGEHLHELNHHTPSTVVRVFLGLAVLASSIFLLTIPRVQTLSDTSLAANQYGILVLSSLVVSVFYLITVIPSKLKVSVVGISVAIISVSSVSNLSSFNFSEKSGYDSGNWLSRHLLVYPDDASRVVFVGDRIANNVGAFTAKIPESDMVTTQFYSLVDYGGLTESPRFVVASPEVYVEGQYREKRLFGDSIVYEFGRPAVIGGYDLERYGFQSSSPLRSTFWGSWIDSISTELIIPEDIKGDTLVLNLVANEELDSTRVQISFDDVESSGDLEENQIVTPVTLKREDGSDWAGAKVEISYSGPLGEAQANEKGFFVGIDSLSIYNSN